MLKASLQRCAAVGIQVTLPQEVGFRASFAWAGFAYDGSASESVDLGSRPHDGEMDTLGNRSVYHSNVKGSVTYGTRVYRWAPGDIILRIPNARDNNVMGLYYNSTPPVLTDGSFALSPKHDERFAYCHISGGFSGDANSVRVHIKVDVGRFFNKETGHWEETVNAEASDVLSPGHRGATINCHCGRRSAGGSVAVVSFLAVFPRDPNESIPEQYWKQIFYDFKPSISKIQLAHHLVAVARTTAGDTKAISDAFQSIRLASFNGLAFTRDTSRLIRDTSRLIRDIRKVRHDPRRLGSIWLSYRYGHRLYYSDCQKLRKGLEDVRKVKPIRFRGRHTEVLTLLPGTETTITYNFTLYASSFSTTDLDLGSTIRSLDFWPSAENLWDLVPYSFVCDWFVNLTDICKRYDMRQDILRFPIKGAVQSVKLATRSVSESSQGSGYADVTLYIRTPLTPASLSTTLLSMNLSFLDGVSLLHTADALALAMKKR